MGSCPKWTIWVSPGVPFWVDSRSGGPITVPFLIRKENTKYWWNPSGLKIWPPPFWTVQLVPRPIFWGDHGSEYRNTYFGLGHQERVGWPPPNWIIQFVSRLIFRGDSESGQGIFKFPLWHLIWLDLQKLGNMTSSIWDGLTCIWTCFLRRFWIWTGKFQIPIVAPNMARSVKIWKYDQLHLGWSNLYLDLFFEGILNLDTKSL